jgi:hypothetical protein
MKSIRQIFRVNPQLMDEPEVEELIEYCRELEGQVMENSLASNYNKEINVTDIVRDIHISCVEIIKQDEDRFDTEEVDYKQAIINLDKYIVKLCEEYKIML